MMQAVDIERWRNLQAQAEKDSLWVETERKKDRLRQAALVPMRNLIAQFLTGTIDVQHLKDTFDRRSRTEWNMFGFKGLSGAMILNMIVNHSPDATDCQRQLQSLLRLPPTEEAAKHQFAQLRQYVTIINATHANKIQAGHLPFFVSMWWHIQSTEEWPVFYLSARQALQQDGVYLPQNELARDYFAFRQDYLALAHALTLTTWQLEHLLVWYIAQQSQPTIPFSSPPEDPAPIAAVKRDEEVDAPTHSQIQWLLAKIGKKVGCQIWIASNDRSRVWQGERLGDLSLGALPGLGLDDDIVRMISLIDVLWIKGHQVVAAFEVEHTTSIYSGLLRMSDLVTSAPNIAISLYIVSPAVRAEQVRRELLRPTFQSLEMPTRCGAINEEDLINHFEEIMRWATEPNAIKHIVAYASIGS